MSRLGTLAVGQFLMAMVMEARPTATCQVPCPAPLRKALVVPVVGPDEWTHPRGYGLDEAIGRVVPAALVGSVGAGVAPGEGTVVVVVVVDESLCAGGRLAKAAVLSVVPAPSGTPIGGGTRPGRHVRSRIGRATNPLDLDLVLGAAAFRAANGHTGYA